VSAPSWWQPGQFAARKGRLETRARIAAAVRRWFAGQGFNEVETPALQVSPGVEPHLRPIAAELHEPFGGAARLYLHTSPEFAMKKLIAAGLPRIYQLAHAYRDGERSDLHHPEFTMLEWYRAQAGSDDVIADTISVVRTAAEAAGGPLRRGGKVCDPTADWERISVAEAFQRFADIDVLAAVADANDLDPDPAAIKREAKRIGVASAAADRFEDVFFRILLDRIEPHLGATRPAVLYDYPLCLGVLAKESVRDPRCAARFEVYVCGVELANGCAELTDPAEHRRRIRHFAALRERLYGASSPPDADFLAAVDSGLPECAGVALGFDRLVMLATGAERIDDVLWAPVATPSP
jgi:elongation factor P--(R)-beta-lysine ligase